MSIIPGTTPTLTLSLDRSITGCCGCGVLPRLRNGPALASALRTVFVR